MAGKANGRRVFAMAISPANVAVAVDRWQAGTGREAILDGDGRTLAQARQERLGAAFVMVALARGYTLRRLFEAPRGRVR